MLFRKTALILLIALNIAAFMINLYAGAVHIDAQNVTQILCGAAPANPAWSFIVLESRLPAAITAMLAGAALGVCGLLLQSFFRNALAGPSILGITSGANLGVAVFTLGLGIASGFALTLIAMAGAMAILLLLLLLSRYVRQSTTLLIVGILISYLTSAIITLLNYYATAQGIQSLMLWGMGSFNSIGLNLNLMVFSALIVLGIGLSIFLIRPLNAWMLGELYAANMGIDLAKTRRLTLFTTGLLAAATTAYCGPIAFVGLSMPHVARIVTRTDNHRHLVPFSALLGSLCTQLCLCISSLPPEGRLLPINALTPLFGIPVVIYILLRKK